MIPEGRLGPWVELATHHGWRRSVGWNIGEDRGRKHLEHMAIRGGHSVHALVGLRSREAREKAALLERLPRPVLWTSFQLGDVMDGWGCKVPLLPADGHPWLCCQPLDVTGDCRDEILCWDLERFWIYTQDRPARGVLAQLRREPLYNFTNYGAHLAAP